MLLAKRTIYPLVLALVINVVEVPKHYDRGHVRMGIIYDSFTPVLDDVLEQLQCLSDDVSQLRSWMC